MSEFEDLSKRVKELEAENLRLQSETSLERSYDMTLQAIGDALVDHPDNGELIAAVVTAASPKQTSRNAPANGRERLIRTS